MWSRSPSWRETPRASCGGWKSRRVSREVGARTAPCLRSPWRAAFGTPNMSHTSAFDSRFLETLATWLYDQTEVLVEIRYRRGGGSRYFEFFASFEGLSQRLRELPAGACITALRRPQLPLRGVVDDAFITRCLSSIPHGVEYLVVETVRRVYGRYSFFHCGSGETHRELRDDLEESRATPVAVGLFPPVSELSAEVIRAVVPDPDGIVRPGPY